MARTKGSKNKVTDNSPLQLMTNEERLALLANLIVDRIYEDQTNGQTILIQIEAGHESTAITTT